MTNLGLALALALSCSVTTAVLLVPLNGVAHAQQPSSSTQQAERLFNEGVALVAKNDYTAACVKFEESQALDPALGTEFNLADCKERTGKLGTAITHFMKVARIAHESGKAERERSANERIASLQSRAPKIIVKLANQSSSDATEGLSITLDETTTVGPPIKNEPLYVDAGAHVVRATAPKFEPFEAHVDVRDGESKHVVVPALVRMKDAAVIAPAPPAPVDNSSAGARRKIAIGLGAAGVVGLAVGSAFGIAALVQRDEAIDACGSSKPTSCAFGPNDPASKWDDAYTSGNIATVGFIVGGALVASGVILYLLSSSAPSSSSPSPPRMALRHQQHVGMSF